MKEADNRRPGTGEPLVRIVAPSPGEAIMIWAPQDRPRGGRVDIAGELAEMARRTVAAPPRRRRGARRARSPSPNGTARSAGLCRTERRPCRYRPSRRYRRPRSRRHAPARRARRRGCWRSWRPANARRRKPRRGQHRRLVPRRHPVPIILPCWFWQTGRRSSAPASAARRKTGPATPRRRPLQSEFWLGNNPARRSVDNSTCGCEVAAAVQLTWIAKNEG